MRKLILVAALALTASLALTACNKQPAPQAAEQAVQDAPKPTDASDTTAWNLYLGQLVQKNMEGMTANQPYAYLVKAPVDDEAKAANDRQLEGVKDTVARGVMPGNLLAFAGPDSTATADLLIAAFTGARPDSFKNVIVLFIGSQADNQRVQEVLKPTGATLRFVEL